MSQITLYQSQTGDAQFEVQLKEETVWLTQKQMAQLFNKDVRTINEHLNNIFKEEELERDPTIRNFRIVQKEGNRQVKREIEHYNLDAIISVGYRVKSPEGTKFRIWATRTLKDHLIKGYTLNQKRLQEKGLDEFERAIELLRDTITHRALSTDEAHGLLDVITNYANTWILLQKFDQETLEPPKQTKLPAHILNYNEAEKAINELKFNLKEKREASDLFGHDRERMLKGILNNLYQTFDGNELYQSLEEKAAHLLYFVIKDHPFVDGNKRIGVFLFVLFLEQNKALHDESGNKKFNDNALVALALLVAESDPKQKETIVRLIMNFVAG